MKNPNILALKSLLFRKNVNLKMQKKMQTAIISFIENILCVMNCGKYFYLLYIRGWQTMAKELNLVHHLSL